MGNICPILTPKTNEKPNINKDDEDEPKSSSRPAIIIPLSTEIETEADRDLTTSERKNKLNESVQSSGTTKGDRFAKNISTTFGSSVLERKNSSLLFQGCIFESSSIILKNSKLIPDGSPHLDENCYTLIDNVFMVKKSLDSIKVVSPHSESQLNCPINSIPSTYYLSEGIPLDSIKEISTGKIIHCSESPIVTVVKLACKSCERGGAGKVRVIKMTFSTSLIHANEIECDECSQKGDWGLVSIESNFPVWGNGHKIEKNEVFESAPNTIRIMGCISCLRYTESEQLPCGCYMCRNCYAENESKECRLCECLE